MKHIDGTTTSCSFCGKNYDRLIVRADSEATICFECVHSFTEKLGNAPKKSIRCIRCQFYQSFVATYQDGTTVLFNYTGQDVDDTAIYVPLKTAGSWNKFTANFVHARCGQCSLILPFRLIWSSPYILARKDRQHGKKSAAPGTE